jgi:hypothetical protein
VREEPTKEKPAVKEKSRTKKATEADYESIFFKKSKPMPVMGKRSISDQEFHENDTYYSNW